MRVKEVGPGALAPDDGPRGRRVVRRVRGIALEVLAFVLFTVLLPVLLAGALIVDLVRAVRRRPWMALRMVAMGWWFLVGEMYGLITLVWLTLTSRRGSDRRRIGIYMLRIRWAGHHLRGVRVLFRLRFETEGVEDVGPGPVIILIRHASIIDNMVPDAVLAQPHGIGLRFVIKRELEMIPTIDIGGRWVPTDFVRRGSKDPATEILRLRRLAAHLGRDEGVLIYPEGTRCTPAKLERAKAVIAERQPEIAPLAARLRHLLPPRLGGPLALIDESGGEVDVVFVGHIGLDGFERISDIWAGQLVGTTVRIKCWRYPAASIPDGEQERTRWLYARWQEMDDWIGAARDGQAEAITVRG